VADVGEEKSLGDSDVGGVLVRGGVGGCWGLALKYYELRTRQHEMLNIDALRPLKHYLPKDSMNFGRRL
jgi:hypothetical protein